MAPVFGGRRIPPVVTGGKGTVVIQGIFEVPHPLFDITGWLVQPEPFTLQLGIRATPTGTSPAFGSLHLYQSRIGRLPKGSYSLQIIYVVDKGTTRDSTVVYANPVTVR